MFLTYLLIPRIATGYWFDYRLPGVCVAEDLLYVKTVNVYLGSKLTVIFLGTAVYFW